MEVRIIKVNIEAKLFSFCKVFDILSNRGPKSFSKSSFIFVILKVLSRVEKSKASFEPLRHNFEAEEG